MRVIDIFFSPFFKFSPFTINEENKPLKRKFDFLLTPFSVAQISVFP